MNTQTPLVSIWSITYNHVNFIRDFLEGVLNQKTNFQYELIIGDDASTDGTSEILIEYAERYPDIIKPIIQKTNIGVYKNSYGTVLPELKGKYIAVCEGDDYWIDPYKLQKQVDFLEANPDFSITFCNTIVKNESGDFEDFIAYQNIQIIGSPVPTIPIPNSVTDISILAKGNFIHTPGVLFKNVFIDNKIPKYLEKVSVWDWPVYLFVAREGKIKYFNDVMCVYRVHKKGIFSHRSPDEILLGELMIYPALIEEGIFEEEIIKVWESKVEGMLFRWLNSNIERNPESVNNLLKAYSKSFPLILYKVFKRTHDDLERKKVSIEKKEIGIILKIRKKISSLIKIW